MGGLAFQIPISLPESEGFLPADFHRTWVIGPDTISLLIRQGNACNALPNLSEEEMNSKSKANELAKSLVCIQALWFIAQCLTRRKPGRFLYTSSQ